MGIIMRKVVFVIDGWFMYKTCSRLRNFQYCGPEIRKYCKKHLRSGDNLYRIFYYDTEPLNKRGHHPLTNKIVDFGKTRVATNQNELFESIKKTPNFALRLGKTVWQDNEWIISPRKVKDLLKKRITIDELKECDIKPMIRQKAVDMKIGLDITHIATKKIADLAVIVTGDADIVPVLKYARREGMQICLDPLRHPVRPELAEHVDFIASYI
jgi:uncharacterized LabA/DUF88 family protein